MSHIQYTACTVKLRPNFQKIAQIKCTTNVKRNLNQHNLNQRNLNERNLTVH